MKLNDLINEFSVFTSNEERHLLDKIKQPCYIETLSEREATVAENLVRKSLLTKVRYQGSTVFMQNEKS
jgi:hypothetical protein